MMLRNGFAKVPSGSFAGYSVELETYMFCGSGSHTHLVASRRMRANLLGGHVDKHALPFRLKPESHVTQFPLVSSQKSQSFDQLTHFSIFVSSFLPYP